MKPSLKNLSSSLSQRHSLKLTLSPPSARLILNVAATETQRHWPTNRPKPLISLRPTPPSASDPAKKSGYWVPDWETHGACRPTPSTNPCWHCPPNSVIGDFLFCLWLVILFGLGWKKRLQIWVGGFFFFFPAVDWWWWWWVWLWQWLMIEVVVVGAVDVFWVMRYIILL